MSYFTNYTISIDCLLQFFYIVRRDPSKEGSGVPDPNEFPPQLRVHSFRFDYDGLRGGIDFAVSQVAENSSDGSQDDPRFNAGIRLNQKGDWIEAVIGFDIFPKHGERRFLIPPDTIVPFMLDLYGPEDQGEILAHTALVLHGVFKGGHRNNLLDAVIDIFRGLGRG